MGRVGMQDGVGPIRAESVWKRACRYAVSDGIPRRSLYVALVVGAVLNLINQGDALLGAAPFDWLKAILTYAVPYAVGTYGAVTERLSVRTADEAVRDA